MNSGLNNVAIILAAGRGTRTGFTTPKTYLEIDNKSILRHAIEAYLTHDRIDLVQVVIHADDVDLYQDATAGLDLLEPVYGGETRASSVAQGIDKIALYSPNHVLIHDGARPFVSYDLITRVLNKLDEYEGVIPAVPVADALWQIDGDRLVAPIDRNQTMRAQTPQGFHYNAYAPIANSDPNALDDAQNAIANGLKIGWVQGDMRNLKMTFKEDFE